MTSTERARIFRPARKLQTLLPAETTFEQEARRVANWEFELLRLQLANGAKPEDLILPAGPVRELRDALVRMLIDVYGRATFDAQSSLALARGMAPAEATFAEPRARDPFEPTVGLDWYRTYALRIVGVHQTAVLNRAKDVVAEQIRAGASERDMTRALGEVFTGFSRQRLANIARTESAKIYEQAHYQEWQPNEDVAGYEVFAIIDDRTSDICLFRDGKYIPKDQVEGWWPPYHVSCRTTLSVVLAWENVKWSVLDGPKPTDGFGTTRMEIPPIQPKARRVVRLAS